MTQAFLGEFFGTLVLIVLGNGVVAGCLLSKSKSQNAGWIVITAGWAFGVICGIFTAKAFGAPGSLNPVGPITDILNGKPFDVALAMIAGEFLGAFSASVLVFLHYFPHWKETSDPGLKLAVFCTAPAIRHPGANLFGEVLGTFVLVFVASALGKASLGSFEPGFVGLVVWVVGLSLGEPPVMRSTRLAIWPRISHALLPIPGKGSSDWGYAWIPVVGPILGAVLASVLFRQVL